MRTVSVIIPVMNEKDTIREIANRIEAVFEDKVEISVVLKEIVFIDDGSTDTTWNEIQGAIGLSGKIKGVRLRRNFGKAAALQVGVSESTGDIIITMDGDLQDDPKEIPKFLKLIDSGADLVSGWKKVRHDPLGKTLPSKLFNRVTGMVTGVKLHDFNCGFKAYRREVFDSVRLYGELHRFIPALAHAMGFKVEELIVEHHPRRFGSSKYGVNRLLKGFLDLLTVVIITKYNSRPGHLFGGLGVVVGAIGLLLFLYLAFEWLGGAAIGNRPLLTTSTLLMTVGLQFTLFGMIAELIVANRQIETTPNIVAEVKTSETFIT
ncbi:glycosyltransferase involved in cell wall biosynthesis [Ochrobactrum sp. J50]|uniref:glycosyltransferase family 2 protein n=1 Tax=Ochrobactrum sp. J50 TaxID=936132 RepID=UPI0011AAC90D|nr:glycosyltransferase family 2 protein [Ochrobactrum sp. J50]TWH02336.1 glycosyltransferase involved in cell wall biosynthesis [Ochrobactrum sp. J50]